MKKNANQSARLRLRVSRAAEIRLRAGHPWVFASSVREQNRDGEAGELAVIYDRKDRFLAAGLFDPESPIRVRILQAGKPKVINREWWTERLSSAADRRRDLFDESTTGYRLIHGESDGWPGLVLDRYDTTLVLKLYTAAWFLRLGEVVELVRERLNPERLVLRLSRNLQERAGTRSDGQVLFGPPLNGPVVFQETGLNFEADVLRGQKTGFFLDQRENRRRVEALASGRAVLNAFSFTGGFSLYAARGGAKAVTDLDLSAHALEGSRRNFALNRQATAVARCAHHTVQADAMEWLRDGAPAEFGLVILDPPSFAKREADRAGAVRAYEKLAWLGIARLAPGGILLACSCSAHVSADEFFQAVRLAARKSGRPFTEIETTRQPADHPATFKEAEYLKGIYLDFQAGCQE